MQALRQKADAERAAGAAAAVDARTEVETLARQRDALKAEIARHKERVASLVGS